MKDNGRLQEVAPKVVEQLKIMIRVSHRKAHVSLGTKHATTEF